MLVKETASEQEEPALSQYGFQTFKPSCLLQSLKIIIIAVIVEISFIFIIININIDVIILLMQNASCHSALFATTLGQEVPSHWIFSSIP